MYFDKSHVIFLQKLSAKFGEFTETHYLCDDFTLLQTMETKFKRLDHKSLVALLLVITRMIKADSRIDASEIQKLMVLERQYNFDHTLMTEASRLTLSEAIKQLRTLDVPTRHQILESLTELGSTDRILERHEALLLLTLRYCLLDDDWQKCDVVSSHISHRSGDLGTYIIYFETEDNEAIHREIFDEWELMKLMLQQNGLQFFFVEHIVQSLCKQDPVIIKKMLEYFAPTKTDQQIDHLYARMEEMDSSTFCQQVFVRSMQLTDLRNSRPSLLINLGSTDLLRIEITDTPQAHIRKFLDDYNRQASPGMTAVRPLDNENHLGHFSYYGYYRDFFNLLVQSEPKESRIVLWPNKSEFEFPQIGRSLRLNQQEASLYSLILVYTYKYNKKGLPLCYSPEQRKIEALYRTIYCRKKFVETEDVIFPDNLAPIRAKIEKKMRDQLDGLDNIEDFIPRNERREGFYRIAAPLKMVCVRPDIRQSEVSIADFEW